MSYQIAVLGDRDSVLGFKALGLETFPADTVEEARTTLHRLDQALQVMDRAVEQLPDHAAVYRERGRIRLLLNDKAGAMDDLKKALQADPETARTLEGHFSNLEQYRTKNADKQI